MRVNDLLGVTMLGRSKSREWHEVKDHVAGAIYGFAIGDSVGGATEFMTPEQIERKYGTVTGHVGGGWLKLEKGEVTDDTQMMVCVMNALQSENALEDEHAFEEACMRNFVAWMRSNPKDIGNRCAISIRYIDKHFRRPPYCEDALGNGALMRYLPCALIRRDDLNVIQGQLTHNNVRSSTSIQSLSKVLFDCLMDNPISEEVSIPQASSGALWDTFNNSIYYAKFNDFSHCMIEAVNAGGDSDTIAAIACSLAGARCGLSNIPSHLVAPLDVKLKQRFGDFISFVMEQYEKQGILIEER